MDQRANQGRRLLLPVGVRTGWLRRSGQEARGCSLRSLPLLIFVFFFEGGDKEAGALAAEWASLAGDELQLAFTGVCMVRGV